MISDEELATTAKEGNHWHSITMQIAAELLQRRKEARKTCKWKHVDWGIYRVCSGQHVMIVKYQFCPFCGRPIEEIN